MDDEEGRGRRVGEGKLDAGEASGRGERGDCKGEKGLPELLCLVHDGGAGVHGLHAQDLVVALLVVEHGRRKVVKHILGREGAMGLYPLVPDEEPVRVVVARVEVLVVHGVRVRSDAGKGELLILHSSLLIIHVCPHAFRACTRVFWTAGQVVFHPWEYLSLRKAPP